MFYSQSHQFMVKKSAAPLIIFLLTFLLLACNGHPRIAMVGEQAPDFNLVDTNNKSWKLSELKGQVVLINFWASWCPPCLQEMPSMQKLYSSMPQDKFKMLAILNNDNPKNARALAVKQHYTFPILIDPGSKVAKAYGLTGVPETFIIDKQGILREKIIGPEHWDGTGAREMLNNFIEKK